MILGERLRELRVQKQLSQADIEERTGLKRSYLSRVENGHTVPSVETLEKWARALTVPLHILFHNGEEPPTAPLKRAGRSSELWGTTGKDARLLYNLRKALAQLSDSEHQLLLHMARKMERTLRERPNGRDGRNGRNGKNR